MAHKLCLQKVYWIQPQQWRVPVCVVTLGVPKEAQTAQRFGVTKRVGTLLVLGSSARALVRRDKEGVHLWGCREKRSSFKDYGIRACRQGSQRQGHLTGPKKGLHSSCSPQGTHSPHSTHAAWLQRPSTLPPPKPRLSLSLASEAFHFPCPFLTGEQRPG